MNFIAEGSIVTIVSIQRKSSIYYCIVLFERDTNSGRPMVDTKNITGRNIVKLHYSRGLWRFPEIPGSMGIAG